MGKLGCTKGEDYHLLNRIGTSEVEARVKVKAGAGTLDQLAGLIFSPTDQSVQTLA